MLRGFRQFLLRGNVIDLAVAVVIGAAFSGIVDALVKDILTPLIAAIGGQPDFSALYFSINGSRFRYGDLINNVINFLFVAGAIYVFVVVPITRVNDLRRARVEAGQPTDEATLPSDELRALREIRDLLADRPGSHRAPAGA